MKSNNYVIQLKWILLEKFCDLSGYSENAIRIKLSRGIWIPGVIALKKAGKIHVNIVEYCKWLENEEKLAA
jgi:hypothetical protein